MVFGLFTRKSALDDNSASPESKIPDHDTRLATPTPSITAHPPRRLPTVLRAVLGGSTTDLALKDAGLAPDSVAQARHSSPAVTPSRPPPGPDERKALHDLMLTIPPKTLHAYTLARILPSSSAPSPALGFHPESVPRPPSPSTVSKLIAFFSTLAPPPLLHCVRCHRDFYDIENEEKDKACRVPHDDESALVVRVSGGGGYETLWGCCGQTAPGDGSQGPPDGWCYEGRHTTDAKRARFRADSTIHDDRLTSCLKSNCHGVRDQLPSGVPHASPSRNVGTSPARKSNPSPVRSKASVVITRCLRKRPRISLKETSSSEDEGDAESSAGRVTTSMGKENAKLKAKAGSRPVFRARPPPSTSTTASLSASASALLSTRAKTTKPKSTSRTLLSQSHVHLASDSETSTRSRPRTRSEVREESRVRDTSRPRATPVREASRSLTTKLTKPDICERARRARKVAKQRSQTPSSEEQPEAEEADKSQESGREGRGRDRKKRRVVRD